MVNSLLKRIMYYSSLVSIALSGCQSLPTQNIDDVSAIEPIVATSSASDHTDFSGNDISDKSSQIEYQLPEEKTNIIYIPDYHIPSFIDMNKKKVNFLLSSGVIDGVLLEGIEFGPITDDKKDDILDFLDEENKYKKDIYANVIEEYSSLMLNPSIRAKIIGQWMHNSSRSDYLSLEDHISYATDHPASSKSYAVGMFNLLISAYEISRSINLFYGDEDEPILALVSPGVQYLGLDSPLFGIENFDAYFDGITSGLDDLRFNAKNYYDTLGTKPSLREMLDEIKNSTALIESYKSPDKPYESREHYIFDNIAELPTGTYVLIMGAIHRELLKEVSEDYPSIEFHAK